MRVRKVTGRESYGIGELARELGVTTRTIRFYEDEGLLAPAREGGRRVYGPRDRTRLKLILRGKRLGFPLAEVAEIIGLYDEAPGEVGQLELLLARISDKQSELEAKRRDIEASQKDLAGVASRCRARLAELGEGPGQGDPSPVDAGASGGQP